VPLEDSDDRHAKRVRHWKESAFAVGCVEPTWMAERTRDGAAAKHLPPDESGCLCCSALVCPLLGAGRVGNMIVLKSSTEWVEEVEEDEESGEQTVRRFSRPKLDLVLGPYWPMLCCVTYPLIFAVSGWTFVSSILPGRQPIVLVFVWTVFTSGLIVSLACTACRDPGILYRHRNAPPQHAGTWRWSDRADSFRPRDAWYDTDTAVVVEGFDHTYVDVSNWEPALRLSQTVEVQPTLNGTVAFSLCPFSFLTCLAFLYSQLSLDWNRHR
jgi:hypothetical protein